MPRGGRREGAGRPAGSGWLPAVGAMRASAAERLTSIVGSSRDPLEVAIDIASDTTLDPQLRLGAASIAIPFLYPKLSSTTVAANHTVTRVDTAEVLQRIEERISRASALPAPLLGDEAA